MSSVPTMSSPANWASRPRTSCAVCSRMLEAGHHPPDRRRAQPLCPGLPRQRHDGLGRAGRGVAGIGRRVGALDFVSHCLPPAAPPRRCGPTTCSPWCMAAAAPRSRTRWRVIAELLGPADRGHDVLYSTRILKKTGLRIVGLGDLPCSESPSSCTRSPTPTPAGPTRSRRGPVVIWNLIRRCNLTLQALLLDLGRHRFPGRAEHGRGLHGHGRPEALSACRC